MHGRLPLGGPESPGLCQENATHLPWVDKALWGPCQSEVGTQKRDGTLWSHSPVRLITAPHRDPSSSLASGQVTCVGDVSFKGLFKDGPSLNGPVIGEEDRAEQVGSCIREACVQGLVFITCCLYDPGRV